MVTDAPPQVPGPALSEGDLDAHEIAGADGPTRRSDAVPDNQKFDYVIVGSGPAGCVLFNRLSENPDVSVLLLEAGHDEREYPMEEKVGLQALFAMWGPNTDWGYATEVEAGLNYRSMPIIQGRVLGGGSSVNGRIHIRGNRKDYDYWNYLGCEGWSFKDLLPYFKKSEDYQGPDNEWNGKGGPVSIQDLGTPSPASQAFIASAVETLGLSGPLPLNGFRPDNACGFSQSATSKDWKRVDMARAYVHPAEKRPNTKVLTQAYATRVLTEGTRAVGVEYVKDGQLQAVRAEREVILAAGPFNSPKLLMLSGIGPSAHLKANDIPVVLDLPGVGENLQDHILVRMGWSALSEQPAPHMISEANLFTHTRKNTEMASEDLQCLFGPFVFPTPEYAGPGFTMVPSIEQASSVGTVRLRSKDPIAPPAIRPSFLSTEGDMQILLTGMKVGREIVAGNAFKGLVGRELYPGPDCNTEQAMRKYIRDTAITEWHPSCTCKMGLDAMSVVDPQLRVYGMTGLRVCDASIMPRIVNANLQATIIMIGEKGADLVKQYPAS
jgi:choline dehydrogenase